MYVASLGVCDWAWNPAATSIVTSSDTVCPALADGGFKAALIVACPAARVSAAIISKQSKAEASRGRFNIA